LGVERLISTAVKFRSYNNTDLTVSEVGFGLWTISTGWWGNFTEGEATVSGSNKKIASPKLGSSFQNAHRTSLKRFRFWISPSMTSGWSARIGVHSRSMADN